MKCVPLLFASALTLSVLQVFGPRVHLMANSAPAASGAVVRNSISHNAICNRNGHRGMRERDHDGRGPNECLPSVMPATSRSVGRRDGLVRCPPAQSEGTQKSRRAVPQPDI